MQINTLVIGYVPLIDTAGKKAREIREDKYYKELFSEFDLGNIYYVNQSDWKIRINEIDPIVVIYLGGEYFAKDIKTHKEDILLYVVDDAGSIFHRKDKSGEKIAKHKKIFEEISGMIKKMRDDGEDEIKNVRKFARMSYDDMYKMIQRAIIGDDEELKEKAWDLLFGEGEKHSDFIWMRVQLMAEVWEHAKGKTLEELILMSMERHIDQGTARKMDNFTDADGLEYYQYMFLDPYGNDANYIRRLPFATKNDDRYGYENLLEKNEIPTNYLRVQVEANSLRKQYDDYLTVECEKVQKILRQWEEDKTKSKKELGVGNWNEGDSLDDPLRENEVEWLNNFLKVHSRIF